MVYFWFSWRQMVLEGRKQAKKKNKQKRKKNQSFLHPQNVLYVLTASSRWSQHTCRTNLIRVPNHIILFSVRCGCRCMNAFLIWCLWGWSQELIASWSGAPEPIVLEGIKVAPPAGLLSLSRFVCTCWVIENWSLPVRMCWNSAPNPDPEVGQQSKKGKRRALAEQFTYGMLIC